MNMKYAVSSTALVVVEVCLSHVTQRYTYVTRSIASPYAIVEPIATMRVQNYAGSGIKLAVAESLKVLLRLRCHTAVGHFNGHTA